MVVSTNDVPPTCLSFLPGNNLCWQIQWLPTLTKNINHYKPGMMTRPPPITINQGIRTSLTIYVLYVLTGAEPLVF